MKRTETIKDKKLFNEIIKSGKFHKNQYYVIYSTKTADSNKYGIAISNKVGNAVTRNRLKRQTRAIIDNNRILFQKNHNYIIMIRKSCANQEYKVLEEALKEILNK